MQYFGGKAKIGRFIAAYLRAVRLPCQVFVEPFCGALNITRLMAPPIIASDANPALITMWRAALAGWTPPLVVSEELYLEHKRRKDPEDPMTAFVGFGCSFGGKWFGGYARSADRTNYAATSAASVRAKLRDCQYVRVFGATYRQMFPILPPNSLIYCDPPYAGTTGYAAGGKWDPALFWGLVRQYSYLHAIFVSEYAAPDDFISVLTIPNKNYVRTKAGVTRTVEGLFTLRGGLGDPLRFTDESIQEAA